MLANLALTLEAYSIGNGAELVLLVQQTFSWDPLVKAEGIKVNTSIFKLLLKLSNNNLTCLKDGESDY